MKDLIKKCKYKIAQIEDARGNPRLDSDSLHRLHKFGTAVVISNTLLFFYSGNLSGFRTSDIKDISVTKAGVCVETLNSKYYLEEVENEKKNRRNDSCGTNGCWCLPQGY